MKIPEVLQTIFTKAGKLLGPVLGIICFLVGCVYFFPLQSLQTQLNTQLSQNSGQDIKVINPSLGTGLGVGLISGGLIALRAEKMEIYLPRKSVQVDCYNLTVTPSLLSILLLKAKVAVQCELDQDGASTVLAIMEAPLWAFEEATVEVELDDIHLDKIARTFKVRGWKGTLNGDVQVSGIAKGPRDTAFEWDLEGSGFATPTVKSDFLNLPPLILDKLESKGNLANRKLLLDSLEIGVQGATKLWASFSANMVLSPQMLPTGGTLKGKMKTDPDFEKDSLKGLNLDLLFGKIKASGLREFTKEVKGNVFSLMMNPPIE